MIVYVLFIGVDRASCASKGVLRVLELLVCLSGKGSYNFRTIILDQKKKQLV